MKNWFFLLLLFLASCDSSETEQKDLPNNFTINGTISGGGNSTIYLESYSNKGTIPVANVQTDAQGNFSLKGNIPGLGIYQLRLGEAKDKVIPLTLNVNEKLTIQTSFNDFEKQPNAKGTNWAKHLNQYTLLIQEVMVSQQEMAKNPNLSEAEMLTRYLEARKPLDEFSKRVMLQDPGNSFNIILSSSLMPTTGFSGWDPKNLDLLTLVVEAFEQKHPNSPITNTFAQQLEQITLGYQQHLNSSSGNKMAPEIALKSPNGELIKLSSLRGNYVLIDFWASWCRPCRMENPNVVKLYQKYKNKGFTVFSVSLDQDATAWKSAIQADGLIWPNHVSDLQGWNTIVTKTYQFNSIPHTVLLDKEGKIIATGLRGPALEQKLQELIK